jgi:hypothetical protein
VTPIKFAAFYDDNGDGTATPKKIMKTAKLADHDGVKQDIFAKTYDTSTL